MLVSPPGQPRVQVYARQCGGSSIAPAPHAASGIAPASASTSARLDVPPPRSSRWIPERIWISRIAARRRAVRALIEPVDVAGRRRERRLRVTGAAHRDPPVEPARRLLRHRERRVDEGRAVRIGAPNPRRPVLDRAAREPRDRVRERERLRREAPIDGGRARLLTTAARERCEQHDDEGRRASHGLVRRHRRPGREAAPHAQRCFSMKRRLSGRSATAARARGAHRCLLRARASPRRAARTAPSRPARTRHLGR